MTLRAAREKGSKDTSKAEEETKAKEEVKAKKVASKEAEAAEGGKVASGGAPLMKVRWGHGRRLCLARVNISPLLIDKI